MKGLKFLTTLHITQIFTFCQNIMNKYVIGKGINTLGLEMNIFINLQTVFRSIGLCLKAPKLIKDFFKQVLGAMRPLLLKYLQV